MATTNDWRELARAKLKQMGQIKDGFVNLIIEETVGLPPLERTLYEERSAMCDDCGMRVGNTCSKKRQIRHAVTKEYVSGCGCNLPASVKSPTYECPAGKWGRVDHLINNNN
ncbi:MAG TPA: hypothetical protein VGB67_04085 [Fibrella sp.]|jgi:hypothetical protein